MEWTKKIVLSCLGRKANVKNCVTWESILSCCFAYCL